MLSTYKGTLKGNRIEWEQEAPEGLGPGRSIAVYVTILGEAESPAVRPSQGRQMAAILEQLAATDALSDLADPGVWEREIRQERDFPEVP